jgi:hypothetical protein
MMLRTPLQSKRSSAENGLAVGPRYAEQDLRDTLEATIRSGHGSAGISPYNHTSSLDGQPVTPSAMLPVLFCDPLVMDAGRGNRTASDAVVEDKNKKGLRAWGHLKSFSRLRRLRVSRRAARPFPNRQLLVQLWGQGQQRLLGAQSCKGLPSAQAQLSSRARPNWSTATSLTTPRIAHLFFNAFTLPALRQRGALRTDISFKIQKGLANV